jgi:hypothetical protein
MSASNGLIVPRCCAAASRNDLIRLKKARARPGLRRFASGTGGPGRLEPSAARPRPDPLMPDSNSRGAVVDEPPQAQYLEDAHMLVIHLDQASVMELPEKAAHGFKLEPEVAAHFLAGHAQVEV